MAKYNLLDDDDIFDEEEKSSSEKPKDTEKNEISSTDEESIEINIDDDLSEIDPTSQIDDDELEIEEKPLEFAEITSEEEQEEPSLEKEPSTDTIFNQSKVDNEGQAPADEKPYLTDDYEDDKQGGLNYKPIIWIALILLGIVLTYFALDYFVFSKADQPVSEQQENVKTPEEIQREQEAARKAQFLGSISAETSSDLNMIGNVINNASSSAKMSAIYLYGDEFLFEVFGKSRDDLAKVNIQLKNQPEKYLVISSTIRPGNNGGVLGVFKAEAQRSASRGGQAQPKYSSISDFETKFKNFTKNSGIKIEKLTNKLETNQNGFQKYEVVTDMKGSFNSCKNFLSGLAANNAHIKIQKLNLVAADQSSFGNTYNLRLILEIFI